MAKMGAALAASHFGAHHAPAYILVLGDIFRHCRLVETGPAAARIKLCLRAEKFGFAANATISARIMTIPVNAGKGPLGAFFSGDMILLSGELLAPVNITLGDCFFVHFNHPQLELKLDYCTECLSALS